MNHNLGVSVLVGLLLNFSATTPDNILNVSRNKGHIVVEEQ